MIRHIFYLLSAIVVSACLYSCNNGSTFSMGQELINAKTDVVSADTFTIRAYTIKADSFITSGTGKALVGSYSDPELGNVKASTFFDFAAPEKELSKTASFVSLTLCMHYSRYVYGDTTQPYKVAVYQLAQKLDDQLRQVAGSTTGYYYNTSKIDSLKKLGEISIIPRPFWNDSIEIPLSDDLGLSLFERIQDWTADVQTTSQFLSFFNGIMIRPENDNSSILGFNDSDTAIYMRLKYKNEGPVDSTLQIKLNIDNTIKKSTSHFNRITCNLSSTKLNTLSNTEAKVASSVTNNQAYVQAGTNIMTRLEFPYIKNLLENSNIKILKAYLILTPVKNTYWLLPLPKSLSLFEMDNFNTITSTLKNSQGTALTPILNIDYEYNENTNYTFDVTNYVSNLLQLNTTNLPAIGVSASSDIYNTTLNRVVFGDGQRMLNASKLKILYWRY